MERRQPPPIVKEIRKSALLIAAAVFLWAAATYWQQGMMLRAVRRMKAASPDTVHVTDTLTLCKDTRDDAPRRYGRDAF